METGSQKTPSPAALEIAALGTMPSLGIVALRTALQALLRRGAPDDGLRRALAVFCGEARRRGLRAEEVLVHFKDVWRSLPEVRRLRRTEREMALARLTTLTIRTFYDPPAGTSSARPDELLRR